MLPSIMKNERYDQSLFGVITSMKESEYNYYNKELKFNTEEINPLNCKEFITNYFKNGDKEDAFIDIEELFDDITDRMIHSTVFFFLCVYFFKNSFYKNKVQDYINAFFKENDLYPKDILRLLFLMCLYHDYGYVIENEKRNIVEIDFYKESELEKITNINKKFFSKPYDFFTITKYYEYRKYREHGIYGGTLLFHRLIKNFKDKAKLPGKNCFVYDKRNDAIFYALIASIIIKHNIWYATDDRTIEEYEKNKLNSLIIKDQSKRLSFEKDPLLYIFCILDTIEPIKAFYDKEKENAVEILKNVEFMTDKYSIRIRINNVGKMGEGKVQKYICKITSLQDWLNVSFAYNGAPNPYREIEINLK